MIHDMKSFNMSALEILSFLNRSVEAYKLDAEKSRLLKVCFIFIFFRVFLVLVHHNTHKGDCYHQLVWEKYIGLKFLNEFQALEMYKE
jgi:hypothetical protein